MKIAVICSLYITNDILLEWMQKSFASIKTKHELYFFVSKRVIDKKYEPLDYKLSMKPASIITLEGYEPSGLSRAMNLMNKMAQGLGVDYILGTQHDIVFKSDAIDNMIDFAEQNPQYDLFSFCEHKELATLETTPMDNTSSIGIYSAANLTNAKFWKQMNYFDENFYPVYWEDWDFNKRVMLCNKKYIHYNGAKLYHNWSAVINSDRKNHSDEAFLRCKDYYERKWGKESEFTHPFNDPNKNINDWTLE